MASRLPLDPPPPRSRASISPVIAQTPDHSRSRTGQPSHSRVSHPSSPHPRHPRRYRRFPRPRSARPQPQRLHLVASPYAPRARRPRPATLLRSRSRARCVYRRSIHAHSTPRCRLPPPCARTDANGDAPMARVPSRPRAGARPARARVLPRGATRTARTRRGTW